MIKNFYQVHSNLYRGGRLSPRDVLQLYNKFSIKVIISLDKQSGNLIDPICNKLGIIHYMIPIHPGKINGIKQLLSYDITKLVNPNIPTYVHCFHGRDRTGLFIALIRCLCDGWDCRKALKEAKLLGFGTGLDFKIEKFFTKLITRSCKHNHEDENHAYDMISDITDSTDQYSNYSIDTQVPISWAPVADAEMREYPYAYIDGVSNDNSTDPFTYDLKDISIDDKKYFPSVGIYDGVSQMTNMMGSSIISGGFI